MRKEGFFPSEKQALITLSSILGIFLASQFAFSLKTRKEIGKRDRWTCQDCGVQFKHGFMVHASHYDHNKKSELYNHPSSGRIQCVDCHETYHELYVGRSEEIGLSEYENDGAINILRGSDRRTRNS